MKVIHASGGTPMAMAAQIHEAAEGNGVRQCCDEHSRADAALAVAKVVARLGPNPFGGRSMNVRAKFKVASRHEVWAGPGQKQVSVALSAATGEGNESWSRWTPSGTIQMTITNPSALDQFALGAEMYVDFSAVDPGAAAPAPEGQ